MNLEQFIKQSKKLFKPGYIFNTGSGAWYWSKYKPELNSNKTGWLMYAPLVLLNDCFDIKEPVNWKTSVYKVGE